ncbi:hypothetical protein EBAPG3_005550 [Nitrosospira lacus]|uniref:Uncharacterized protein n=1 Tax=Nitrosospira lacus TaxID=1288494 RepID=A0A1W6SNA0_9PROT|nr:hypothetical protein [Nitrosospira lacus]ARO87275.1 hypothetical protein EBAPG3_005550 [Nitrosospira lacus]
MEITCYRDNEVGHDSRYLPAATYNLAITLLARCPSGHLFVPIRSMQYLAILDAEEFVFLDGERRCWIDIAWRNFRSRARTSLDQPVEYDAVYYRSDPAGIMSRLQTEFPRALQVLAGKAKFDGTARVIKFPASSV